MLFDTPGISRCHNTFFSMNSSLIRHRFYLSTIDWVIDGSGNLHVDQMFRTTAEAENEGLDPGKQVKLPPLSPSNLILTVPRRYFCCGSSRFHVVMSCV